MVDDEERNENVDESEIESEIDAESLIAENIEEPVNMSLPHVEPVTTTDTANADDIQEDSTADLPPRKQSRRYPRISGEDNVEVQTTTEIATPVDATQPKFNYILSELNPKINEFMANERVVMYMPVPKPGEGSSSGPSDVEVLRAAELLQTAAREIEAAAKSKQDETHANVDSSDSVDLFEENETTILMQRITIFEEDKIFKDAQIASLMEELVVKNQKIHELETNLGALSVVVVDMKQKVEGKFPKEFADPPKETTAKEREKERKEHEDAMNCYFENPPRTANQKPRKKMVVMRNVGAERDLEFGDRPDRYVITTEKAKHGNRLGIHNWAYNDVKGMFIVRRNNGDVEFYTILLHSSLGLQLI
ncbi:hypothetical protein HanPI659440_Chr14g0548911 [Helianthus annuus]|nr:hypothetical protein HanPI659440_Chr14g0548911 [Helianthus annuus]